MSTVELETIQSISEQIPALKSIILPAMAMIMSMDLEVEILSQHLEELDLLSEAIMLSTLELLQ